jgi:cation:H+ antiporter
MTALLFIASFVIIVIAAELFTNAVEWAGYRMKLGKGATGSLLAAIGTTLPETAVPVVALVTHAPSADAVAQGSVLGAPFLLLTVGIAITGLAVLSRRGKHGLEVDPRQARRDLSVFLVAFSVALAAVAAPHALRIVIGVALLLCYAAYVVATLRGGSASTDLPEPLHIVRWRAGQPHTGFVTVQLLVSIGLLILGSALFVDALNRAADALHIAPLILALVVVPLATELPETLNSVLWVRSRDDTLAFGNIAGAATFQACILGFVGVTFTSWEPGAGGIIGGVLTAFTALVLLLALRRGRAPAYVLVAAVIPWLGYLVAQVATGGRLGV